MDGVGPAKPEVVDDLRPELVCLRQALAEHSAFSQSWPMKGKNTQYVHQRRLLVVFVGLPGEDVCCQGMRKVILRRAVGFALAASRRGLGVFAVLTVVDTMGASFLRNWPSQSTRDIVSGQLPAFSR